MFLWAHGCVRGTKITEARTCPRLGPTQCSQATGCIRAGQWAITRRVSFSSQFWGWLQELACLLLACPTPRLTPSRVGWVSVAGRFGGLPGAHPPQLTANRPNRRTTDSMCMASPYFVGDESIYGPRWPQFQGFGTCSGAKPWVPDPKLGQNPAQVGPKIPDPFRPWATAFRPLDFWKSDLRHLIALFKDMYY